MLTTAGKYLVNIEKTKLILMHPAGISFDLTQKDAMALTVLISNWQRAMRMGPYERESEAKQNEEEKTIASDDSVSHSGR